MSKTAVFEDKKNIARALLAIGNNEFRRNEGPISYHLMRKLEQDGYIKYTPAEEKGPRGRYPKVYRISGKGKSFTAIARNWKGI